MQHSNLQPATNKASIGRKATLGLRQIAALMAPSVSTQSQSLLRAPSCRQCGSLLHLANVESIHNTKQHTTRLKNKNNLAQTSFTHRKPHTYEQKNLTLFLQPAQIRQFRFVVRRIYKRRSVGRTPCRKDFLKG